MVSFENITGDKSICLAVTQIENCLKYDVKETINGSTIFCNKCAANYYLDSTLSKQCLARSNENGFCLEFEL